MGLFSFIEGAGEKLFGGGDSEKEAIEKHINEQNLPVEDLYVVYDEGKVTVNGSTKTQETKDKVTVCCGNVEGVQQVQNNMFVSQAAPAAVAAAEASAPAPEAAAATTAAESTSQFHDVVSGDTLGGIAKKYYGNAGKYPVIFEANRPMLSDPDKIYPGQKLVIPAL